MKKCVIFVRPASHEDVKISIESQLCKCREFAERFRLEIVAEYIEPTALGCIDHDQRPMLKKLISDSESHTFDTVLVLDMSCFSRCYFEMMRALKALQVQGVEVESIYSVWQHEYMPAEECYKGVFDRKQVTV